MEKPPPYPEMQHRPPQETRDENDMDSLPYGFLALRGYLLAVLNRAAQK